MVSIPATCSVAVPTLNRPYFAWYTSRSPTAKGTAAGLATVAVTVAAPAAVAVAAAAAGAGARRGESLRTVSARARSAVASPGRAVALPAARRVRRARPAAGSR